MNYTTNYNLKKPAQTDYVNVQDLDDNFDVLDANLYAVVQESADNVQRLDSLKTFVPISTQVVAASGNVEVPLSTIDWTKWREVSIWIEDAPNWTPPDANYKGTTVTLNDLPSGSVSTDQFCWRTKRSYTTEAMGAAGYMWEDADPGGTSVLLNASGERITLFPGYTNTSKVRIRCEGPVDASYGGSDTVAYSALTKIVLRGPSSFTLLGATIRIMGVL